MKTKERYTQHGRERIKFEGQGRTHQEFADDANINVIMKRFLATGVFTHIQAGEPFYGDFSEATDYATAVARVRDADEAFDGLPSAVRALCENDPEKFLIALSNPETAAQLVKAGLEVDDQLVEPVTVRIENPPVVEETPKEGEGD